MQNRIRPELWPPCMIARCAVERVSDITAIALQSGAMLTLEKTGPPFARV